jgi:hypothetical protein
MKSWQAILLICVLAMGVVSGLVYGWLVNPVEYVNTNTETLRIDYQTDLVLMAADIYAADSNSAHAIQRLYLLRRADLKELMTDCLEYATRMNFSTQDIQKMVLLKEAIDLYFYGSTRQP